MTWNHSNGSLDDLGKQLEDLLKEHGELLREHADLLVKYQAELKSSMDMMLRIHELEMWQRDVADGFGFLNRPEGQSGYEVAEPCTIVDAWRAMVVAAGYGPCEGCGGPGVEPHPCPFKEEINGDAETLCNCCDVCAFQCAQDV